MVRKLSDSDRCRSVRLRRGPILGHSQFLPLKSLKINKMATFGEPHNKTSIYFWHKKIKNEDHDIDDNDDENNNCNNNDNVNNDDKTLQQQLNI